MKNRKTYFTSIIFALITGVIGTYLVISNYGLDLKDGVVQTINNKYEISENSISPSVDKLYNAVVVVITYKGNTQVSTGTGFVYKQENGKSYIMTNNHVVDGGDNVKVILSNNNTLNAKIIGKEAFSDIAVLTIDETKEVSLAILGDSTKAKLGDTVFTIGSPLGIDYSGTVTKGILSGKDRIVEVSLSGSTSDWLMKTLQTDAAINPGNSGGPLANINGEVIGVNSLKLVEEKIEGMGFAIPIEDALHYASILEKGEKVVRPYLGVTMYDLTEAMGLANQGIIIDESIKKGVIIGEIEKNSPADKAGLKKGDVIYEINGSEASTKAKLRYELYKNKPNDEIVIKYYRGKDIQTTKAKLATLPTE